MLELREIHHKKKKRKAKLGIDLSSDHLLRTILKTAIISLKVKAFYKLTMNLSLIFLMNQIAMIPI